MNPVTVGGAFIMIGIRPTLGARWRIWLKKNRRRIAITKDGVAIPR